MNKVKASVTSAFIAAAVSGMLSGSASASTPATGAMELSSAKPSQFSGAGVQLVADETTDAGKHDCKGKNSCKGQGGCKSSDNGCKGKNSCKGKGGCNMKDEKKS